MHYRPKTPPVSTISCQAMEGSPTKPEILQQWERQPKPQYDHFVRIYLLYYVLLFNTALLLLIVCIDRNQQ